MGQKQDRKYQNQEMSTFFFALDYVLESLQKSRLYVNNKKSSITRENAFLKQIKQLFLVTSYKKKIDKSIDFLRGGEKKNVSIFCLRSCEEVAVS